MDAYCETHVLGPEDAGLLRRLLEVLGEAFEDPENYTAAPPDEAYLRRLLAGDTFVAVVALVGGEVVGGIAGYLLPKFERERSELYLYDLAVLEAHRRRGVATALIDALARLATARGAYVIFVQADRGDDPAVALYETLGRREDVLHFDIDPR